MSRVGELVPTVELARVTSRENDLWTDTEFKQGAAMPISIRKAPTRAQRVEVDVLPAQWQEYIAS